MNRELAIMIVTSAATTMSRKSWSNEPDPDLKHMDVDGSRQRAYDERMSKRAARKGWGGPGAWKHGR